MSMGDDFGMRIALGMLVIVILATIFVMLLCAIAVPMQFFVVVGLSVIIITFAYTVGYIAERVLDSI